MPDGVDDQPSKAVPEARYASEGSPAIQDEVVAQAVRGFFGRDSLYMIVWAVRSSPLRWSLPSSRG